MRTCPPSYSRHSMEYEPVLRREAKRLCRSEGAKAARLRRRGAKVCLEVRRKSTDKESMNKGSSTDKERSEATRLRLGRFRAKVLD